MQFKLFFSIGAFFRWTMLIFQNVLQVDWFLITFRWLLQTSCTEKSPHPSILPIAMWWVHPSKQPTNSVRGKNIGQVSREQEIAKAFGKCWLAASWLNFADSPDLIWLIQGKSELKVGEFRDEFFVLRFTKRAGERFKAPGIFPSQKGPATFSPKKSAN